MTIRSLATLPMRRSSSSPRSKTCTNWPRSLRTSKGFNLICKIAIHFLEKQANKLFMELTTVLQGLIKLWWRYSLTMNLPMLPVGHSCVIRMFNLVFATDGWLAGRDQEADGRRPRFESPMTCLWMDDGPACYCSTLLLRDFGRGRPEINSLCTLRVAERDLLF